MEWIDHRTPAGQEAGCIICVVGNILVVPLEVNAFQLVIESGLAEAFLAVVKAYELRGASKVQDANPLSGMMPMYGLARLDLAAPDAQPIVELLAGMGSALRFTLEHPLEFLKDFGLTTASCCAVSLALHTKSSPRDSESHRRSIVAVLLPDGVCNGVRQGRILGRVRV